MNDAIRMQLSAFVDGELPENEAELLLRRMTQDAELRRQVADYLAIGRLMRSEPGIAGADRLHERVAAAIDENLSTTQTSAVAVTTSRAVKPLARVAIAASVALVAIFVLQQSTGVDDSRVASPVSLANDAVPRIDAQLERQRQYFRIHSESSSQLGANNLVSQVVTFRFIEDVVEETDTDANDSGDEPAADRDEAPAQP